MTETTNRAVETLSHGAGGLRINAGGDAFAATIIVDEKGSVSLAPLSREQVNGTYPPLVEVITVGGGRTPPSGRLVNGTVSASLRYVRHDRRRSARGYETTIELEAPGTLRVRVSLSADDGIAAVRAATPLTNLSAEPCTVQSVTSLVLPADLGASSAATDLSLSYAESEWFAESRWTTVPLRQRLIDVHNGARRQGNDRGQFSQSSSGTWSTGRALPVGVLSCAKGALAWQIEHNGGWRWETGEGPSGVYLALSGPTDADHQWLLPLRAGESFTTVPVTVAIGRDLDEAIGALTDARRARRRPHSDNAERPVVFNDYMNTLMGEPSTERLLPLIDAAAEVGAEIFCIDAGWYDDGSDWWFSVGDWIPSTTRFPDGGLTAVLAHIRERGMIPGLWLEPESVGVNTAAAAHLPAAAFLQRAGERVIEHGRLHLDLRHPATVEHLDAVIDRLVTQMGIGYFKFDYNINPGAGTELFAPSPGAGLLEHNRAHLSWLDRTLDRHPHVIIENCASGGMRADYAMLSRLQLQSTSDQEDPEAYAPIAALAPLLMLPEQAANWAYPQPDMTDDTLVLTLCMSILGRFYLSGHIDGMTPRQKELVSQAIDAHRSVRGLIAAGAPYWPLGIDLWGSPWAALGLHQGDQDLLTIWRRNDAPTEIDINLSVHKGHEITVSTLFPLQLEAWEARWDRDRGILSLRSPTALASARTFRLERDRA